MKYMGSKAKVARYIVPIIQKQIERSGCETYLEPFCGGCNVIDKIDYYHAWEPPFSNLRATEICCIITLESHHYI